VDFSEMPDAHSVANNVKAVKDKYH